MSDRAKILVVDDVPGQRLALEAALAELGEEVIAVGSALEALRVLLEHDVAVILLDVNMPGMDGFEVAKLIRQRPRTRHTPIIFLTADTNEILAARAYSLGAVDYLFNPFPPDVLRAKVRVFVELAKLHERERREAEQQLALSRAHAAREAAEHEMRRLRLLADASSVLTRSLDAPTLVGDLLGLLVPGTADLAAVVLRRPAGDETWWREAGTAPGTGRGPVPGGDVPDLPECFARAMATSATQTIRDADGAVRGVVAPLVGHDRTFGAMMALMAGSARRFADADLQLLGDIAGRTAVALDNSRLYREIQARDQQKDEFLAMLSHELRNPLSTVTTAVHLLGRDDVPAERAGHARDVIRRQTEHLARIIDDLLDVARVTSGRITLTPEPLDLGQAAERIVADLRLAGRLDQHDVTVKSAPAMVVADRARMEQVITNLVVNAVKYTDRGGRIDVDVATVAGEAVLTVRDTGIGIGSEMLPRLFDLFVQGRQALDRGQGGLGVGLTLVRRLLELQGGRVEASSDGPGQGSSFVVRLPCAPAGALHAAPGVVRGARAPALRILVVEDSGDARDMLRLLLEQAGHEVHEAADGLEGLQVAARVRPEVALIDLGLPGLDGFDVAAKLRVLPECDGIALVAVTGYGQPADRRKTGDAGFDRHLVKPVDAAALAEVLVWAAARRRGAPALRHSA